MDIVCPPIVSNTYILNPISFSGGPLFTIRDAVSNDVPEILAMIRELAEYERLSHQVVATVDSLTASLFGPDPCTRAMIAEVEGQPAGYAMFFTTFSSFVGKAGLFVEDVFVRPRYRRQGVGKEFFRRLAQRAVDRNCGRMEFSVLDWNKPALDFYQTLGAVALTDWTIHRFTGQSLRRLAE
jgi:GNAT superfamily N-acetyltransferase